MISDKEHNIWHFTHIKMISQYTRCYVVIIIAFLSSCSSVPYVRELDFPILDSTFVGELINPDKFTEHTDDLLEEKDLLHDFYRHPAKVVIELRRSLAENPSAHLRMALVEVCSNSGDHLASDEPMEAVGYHLAAAEAALPTALNGSDAEERVNLREMYNYSCGRIAQILYQTNYDWEKIEEVEGPDRTYRLRCRTSGMGFISPAYFDNFWAAKNLEFKGIKNLKRNIRPGFGEMMVGHREYSEGRLVKEPLLSDAGISLPVSVIIEPLDNKGLMEMTFHDVMVEDTTSIAGQSIPLAVDFTAPLAMIHNYTPKGNLGKQGLLHPERYAERMGLVQFEPYRSNEIPVVFVHGLASSPATWMTALNKLREDPNLRKRFQLLAFYYNTGFPIAYNADGLRQHLKKFQDFYDPEGNNPNMSNVLVIGHSMGGILSNSLIRNSGDTFSKEIFTKPIDEVEGLSDRQKAVLKQRLIYQASPYISRTVYVAAPHRGSGFATNPIGHFTKKLIKFPVTALTAGELLLTADMSDDLTEFGERIVTKGSTGINSLEPDNPLLNAILRQPVREGVEYHSIIGQTDLRKPIERGSDKVVPYSSAHLEGAESELIVNARHTRLTGLQEGIEELRRILYIHAGLSYTSLPVTNKKIAEPTKRVRSKPAFYGHRKRK